MRPKCGEKRAEREEEKSGERMKELGGREGRERSRQSLVVGESCNMWGKEGRTKKKKKNTRSPLSHIYIGNI